MKLNKKGVSLPELLAVIVIMGLIAAISIPAFSSMIKNSKKDKILTEAKNLIDKVDTVLKSSDITEDSQITLADAKDIADDYNNDVPFFGTAEKLKDAIFIIDGNIYLDFFQVEGYDSSDHKANTIMIKTKADRDMECSFEGWLGKNTLDELGRECVNV